MSLTKIGGAVSNPSVRADIEQLQSDRMLFVDSVADLAGLVGKEDGQQVSVKGYHTGSDVGGGVFYWDSSRTGENDGGTVFDGWVRIVTSTAYIAEWFGVHSEAADNTAAYDTIVNAVPSGSVITWGSSETYNGDFVSAGKGFTLDLSGATLVPIATSAIRMFGIGTVRELVPATLPAGAVTFDLAGDQPVAVGALITLWDRSERNTGGAVNFETVRVKSSSTAGGATTVLLDWPTYSHKESSTTIQATVYNEPLQAPSVCNGRILNLNGVTDPLVFMYGADGPISEDITTELSSGDAVSHRFSVGGRQARIKVLDPIATSSGRGYGCSFFGVSKARQDRLFGRGTRHLADFDSCYDCHQYDIDEVDAKSAVSLLAHNGFGGYNTAKKVRGVFYVPANVVRVSADGYSATGALRINHPVNGINISDVKSVLMFDGAVDSAAWPVVLQCDADRVVVEGVTIETSEGVPATTMDGLRALSVSGEVKEVLFTGLVADYVARPLTVDNNISSLTCTLVVSDLSITNSLEAIASTGYNVYMSNINAASITRTDWIVILLTGSLGATPKFVSAQNIRNANGRRYFRDGNSLAELRGSIPSNITTDVYNVVSGGEIPEALFYKSNGLIRLIHPAGGGSTSLSTANPLPYPTLKFGEVAVLSNQPSRPDVIIPASATVEIPITVPSGGIVRIVSFEKKWRPYS
jgi:hypothetical protein